MSLGKIFNKVFSGNPKISRVPTRSSTQQQSQQNVQGTTFQDSTLEALRERMAQEQRSRQYGQDQSSSQLTGLRDREVLQPLRNQLLGASGAFQPSGIEQDALSGLSNTLGLAQDDLGLSGYLGERGQILRDVATAGNRINAGAAAAGLSGSSSDLMRSQRNLQNTAQDRLLESFNRNRAQGFDRSANLAQMVANIGQSQSLRPLTASQQYGDALSPFDQQRTGQQQQTGTDATDVTSTATDTQRQNQTQKTMQDLETLLKQTGRQQGEQITISPSNLQNLISLLGAGGGIASALRPLGS